MDTMSSIAACLPCSSSSEGDSYGSRSSGSRVRVSFSKISDNDIVLTEQPISRRASAHIPEVQETLLSEQQGDASAAQSPALDNSAEVVPPSEESLTSSDVKFVRVKGLCARCRGPSTEQCKRFRKEYRRMLYASQKTWKEQIEERRIRRNNMILGITTEIPQALGKSNRT